MHLLEEKLEKRRSEGLLRELSIKRKKIDFASNDYLGFARSKDFLASILERCSSLENVGSTGSRLLTGNSAYTEELEKKIANFHRAKEGLLFNSGYAANVGLLSAIGNRDDSVLYDANIHASILDGIILSRCRHQSWKHNDLFHLETLLKKQKGRVFVCVESIYSVDGSLAPLQEIADLCAKYEAHLIVDEAHATGVFREGLVHKYQLENKVFARVHTFGKALGVQGGVVLGKAPLRKYLINHARSFIYSTAPTFLTLVSIECAYEKLQQSDSLIKNLHQNMSYFGIPTPIIGVKGTEEKWKELQKQDLDISFLRYPTVPKGENTLRIVLHSFNSKNEMDQLCAQL